MFNTLDDLELATLQWSHDRGITINGKDTTQGLKLVSEVGELCDNLAKGADVKDDIGDCLVVLTNLAKLRGTSLVECWNVAYEDIKDRKGFLNEHGNFIKSTDPKYNQLLMEFEGNQEPIIEALDAKVDGILFESTLEIRVRFKNQEGFILLVVMLNPSIVVPDFQRVFIGKTQKQLESYLKTLGEMR